MGRPPKKKDGEKSVIVAGKRRSLDSFDEALANAQLAEVQRLAAAHTADAIRSLVEIATATERQIDPNPMGYFELVLDADGEPIRKGYLPGPRVQASRALLEHAHGRPSQRHETADSLDAKITVVLQSFTDSARPLMIDVTPTQGEPVEIASPSPERVAAA